MSKTPVPVILSSNSRNYFEILIKNLGYNVFSIYRGQNLICRNLRKIWFKYNLPLHQIWYRKDPIRQNHKTNILFDSLVTKEYLKWLEQKLKNRRLIFWYWNPVKKSIVPGLLNNTRYETWSYAPIDCDENGLKYNSQFYFSAIDLPEEKVVYDVYFLGRDKGRLSELLELKEKLELLKLNVKFHIAPNQRRYLRKNDAYQKLIPYNMALGEMAKSKSILDILSNPRDGLSLRTMESLFHERKLITNSQTIIDYDFYNAQNIFILGKDKLEDLPSFINTPYKKVDKRIVDSYDFEKWIKRF